MTGNQYQEQAMRTNDGKATSRLNYLMRKTSVFGMPITDIDLGEAFDAALGLSGETGELCDIIKKWVFHEKPFDEEHAMKELGDVMWYVAMMCHAFGWNLDDILEMNVEKLKARYPEGFDVERANNRKEGDI